MLQYILRRLGYGLVILIGVNLITFLLFFTVNTPDDMARLNIGGKRVTPDQIEKWKVERGYDKPMLFNDQAQGTDQLTQTVFWERSVSLFVFDFGRADNASGGDIGYQIAQRMGVSLRLTVPIFVLGLLASVIFALWLVMFRGTRVDFWGVVACVVMMSISSLFYIIVGQYLFSRVARLAPISGYAGGLDAVRFLLLPICLMLVASLAGQARFFRTLFLEEAGKDYVRTARAKGLAETAVMGRHVLRNAMLPMVTLIGLQAGTMLGGSVVVESVFSLPGLGRLAYEAVVQRDLNTLLGIVFISALLVIAVNFLVDLLYARLDPRIGNGGAP